MLFCTIDWLIGWFVCFVCLLVGWFFDWLIDWLIWLMCRVYVSGTLGNQWLLDSCLSAFTFPSRYFFGVLEHHRTLQMNVTSLCQTGWIAFITTHLVDFCISWPARLVVRLVHVTSRIENTTCFENGYWELYPRCLRKYPESVKKGINWALPDTNHWNWRSLPTRGHFRSFNTTAHLVSHTRRSTFASRRAKRWDWEHLSAVTENNALQTILVCSVHQRFLRQCAI